MGHRLTSFLLPAICVLLWAATAFAVAPGTPPFAPIYSDPNAPFVCASNLPAHMDGTQINLQVDLAVCNIPANSMGPTGHIEITQFWTTNVHALTGGTATRFFQVRLGPTLHQNNNTTINGVGGASFDYNIWADQSQPIPTKAQKSGGGNNSFSTFTGAPVLSTVDMTLPQTLTISAKIVTGDPGNPSVPPFTSADIMTLESYYIAVYR